jgi:hypothetical protein
MEIVRNCASRWLLLLEYKNLSILHFLLTNVSFLQFDSRMLRKYCHEFTVTIPSDSATSVTSFHFSHFFCFVRSFKNEPERTPFYCFIFCRTTSLFAVAILPALASTTRLVTLVAEKVTGDKSSKRFRDTAFDAT